MSAGVSGGNEGRFFVFSGIFEYPIPPGCRTPILRRVFKDRPNLDISPRPRTDRASRSISVDVLKGFLGGLGSFVWRSHHAFISVVVTRLDTAMNFPARPIAVQLIDHGKEESQPQLDRCIAIEGRLEPFRERLLNHPVYREINRIDALRRFMELHVFAVWDFMSLLKALQRRLCCVEVPWLPPADPQACRLINEIVLAEESDDDGKVGFASHFELYRRSMRQCGASTAGIDGFLDALRGGASVHEAIELPIVPEVTRPFLKQTFRIIESDQLCPIASAFTFGREKVLPGVFERIVDKLNAESRGQLSDFRYYLERHIGLDGDEHGPMAIRLVTSLCGSNESLWQLTEETAIECLGARERLWDGIYGNIRS